jgi:hypothetical protein
VRIVLARQSRESSTIEQVETLNPTALVQALGGDGDPSLAFLGDIATVHFSLEMRLRLMSTVRFSKVVEAAGKPMVHVLWVDPEKDPVLKKAIETERVMTVRQGLPNGKADYGTVGFEKGVSGQILIFPESLKRFADKQVTGVKYDLFEWPTVPKSQQVRKVVPPKRSAKGKPNRTQAHVVTEPPVVAEPAATVIKFPNPEDEDASETNPEIEELKKQVRLAIQALEEGKQVAAFKLLSRILDS